MPPTFSPTLVPSANLPKVTPAGMGPRLLATRKHP